jgi:crossover junction endodeoxyribonuclease RuvC
VIILGIDPGFQYAGYSILKKTNNKILLVDCGYLVLPQKETIPIRIKKFHEFFEKKIVEMKITDIAIETPFLGKNAQNFLKLGYLRGIIYLLSVHYTLTVHEYSPREIKQAITGFGGASKEQVSHILLQLFPGLVKPKREDATDALAVGLCALWK